MTYGPMFDVTYDLILINYQLLVKHEIDNLAI